MKLRFTLAVISVLLTLAISADHKSISCSECWRAFSEAPSLDQSLGVNIHFTDAQPGEVRMISDAGFRWVRMDFKWDATERERGRYDFSSYDRLLKSLDEFQIRALFILDYGNPLYDSGGPPRTDTARQAFAHWAAAAARHFQNRGVIWEIYNEPNLKTFWPPKQNAGEYQALASTVARAFHADVPNEKLIGPATSTIDFDFLEACFKANLLDDWSGVSIHPYRQGNPETAAGEYARLREMIQKYGSARVPIISGEWGYSSVWAGMNEEKQAAMLARTFLTNVANGIPISIWYDWRDDGGDPKEAEHHFGLVHHQYRTGQSSVYEPKPAYLAAKTLSDKLGGYRFLERLAVGSDDDYVLVFSRDNDRRIVAWTTSSTTHRIIIPGMSGEFSATIVTGENAGRLSANQDALSIEISGAPIYLAAAVARP